jgi:HPt (histidine-containing phosphotransfer) domain-containing protein
MDFADVIEIEMPAGLEKLVPGYLEARRNEVPRMMELLATASFGPLSNLAHNLKGTGTSYGFPTLTSMGRTLEESAKRMDAAALSAQLAELGDYLSRVQLTSKLVR